MCDGTWMGKKVLCSIILLACLANTVVADSLWLEGRGERPLPLIHSYQF